MKMKMNVGKEIVMGKMMMTWQRGGDNVLTWLKKVTWRVMWPNWVKLNGQTRQN